MPENKIFAKFKNFKHKEVLIIVIIIVLIAVLMVSAVSSGKTSKSVDIQSMSAKERLTYEIHEAVSAISGDDDCKIVLVWDMIPASEKEENSLGSFFTGGNDDTSETVVSGVAVVCKNGDDAKVKVDVTLMLSRILGISADKISVNGKK